LGTVTFAEIKSEIATLTPDERKQLEAALKSKLEFHNPVIQAKVASGVDLIEVAVGIMEQVVGLVNQVKALFSA
jgi:hypothetical protein